MDFLRASAGNWLSQRNSHYLAARNSEGERSEVAIVCLEPGDPKLIELCALWRCDPGCAAGGITVAWQGPVDPGGQAFQGQSALVVVPDASGSIEGTLLRDTDGTGRYRMGAEQVLTLTTASAVGGHEERIWFASPNLRLRARVSSRQDSPGVATFFSEIRKMRTQPKSQPQQSTRVWPSQQSDLPDWIKQEAAGARPEAPSSDG